ncbi:MAG: tRNA pseudouridine(13) synthase TruD [Phycisphaerales bacterium]|nr:tRNA pseudouridine(13) synthase TruD [Phycisphaerales bacterium]
MTIRRLPTDFRVDEVPVREVRAGWLSAPPGRGHVVYELTKTSLTTPDACAALAKTIGLRGGAADYAGLKDKHARTVQFVSLPWDGPRMKGSPPAQAAGTGWSARLEGWSPQGITAEAIACNRFTICIRDLSPAASDEMDARAGLLAERDKDGWRLVIINYFGDQRFGSARAGRGFMARRLIEGDFEGALRLAIGTPARKDAPRVKRARKVIAEHWGRWAEALAVLEKGPERRVIEGLAAGGDYKDAFASLPYFEQVMAVESYQSRLWNGVARRLAARMAGGDALRAEDVFGEMLFAPARTIGVEWRGLEVPLLASTSRLEGEWAGAAAEVLAEEGIGVEQLRIPGLRRPAFGEAMRPLVVRAEGFEMPGPEGDELCAGGRRLKRTARFELPRGAYATVVLRALGQ